ncbi:hypothetical protein PRELSG_1322700 [Plasmodium relictum]|uniref:WD and tetratricopeptide repeats protein 1 n=1 Tax=Plasmodium relictum TaxID=85471 RepID=A0A1J1HHW9_PLARL|nr:hypothetical protein PRELSG_1322700 [Plasmodium relictum]CRH03869.1 hypothetical protein PRELSG_1322700 [Plasmodium relictum]
MNYDYYQNENIYNDIRKLKIDKQYFNYINQNVQSNDKFISRLQNTMTLTGHEGCVNRLKWNDDNHLLASASDDRKVLIWNINSYKYKNKPKYTIETGHFYNIFGVAFIDNDYVVTGSMDRQVRVHNIQNSSYKDIHKCHSDRVKHLATIPKHNKFIYWSCSEDGTVRQFDTREKHICNPPDCKNVIINYNRVHNENKMNRSVPNNTNRKVNKFNYFLKNRYNLLRAMNEHKYLNMEFQREMKAIAVNPLFNNYIGVCSNDMLIRVYDRRMLNLYKKNEKMNLRNSIPSDTYYPKHLWNYCDEDDEKKLNHNSLFCTHLAWSNDGKYLGVTYNNEHVYLFNFLNKEEEKCLSYNFVDNKCTFDYEKKYDILFPPYYNEKEDNNTNYLEERKNYIYELSLIKNIEKLAGEAYEKKQYFEAEYLYNECLNLVKNKDIKKVLYCNLAITLIQRKAKNDAYLAEQYSLEALKLDPSYYKAIYRRIQANIVNKKLINAYRITLSACKHYKGVIEFFYLKKKIKRKLYELYRDKISSIKEKKLSNEKKKKEKKDESFYNKKFKDIKEEEEEEFKYEDTDNDEYNEDEDEEDEEDEDEDDEDKNEDEDEDEDDDNENNDDKDNVDEDNDDEEEEGDNENTKLKEYKEKENKKGYDNIGENEEDSIRISKNEAKENKDDSLKINTDIYLKNLAKNEDTNFKGNENKGNFKKEENCNEFMELKFPLKSNNDNTKKLTEKCLNENNYDEKKRKHEQFIKSSPHNFFSTSNELRKKKKKKKKYKHIEEKHEYIDIKKEKYKNIEEKNEIYNLEKFKDNNHGKIIESFDDNLKSVYSMNSKNIDENSKKDKTIKKKLKKKKGEKYINIINQISLYLQYKVLHSYPYFLIFYVSFCYRNSITSWKGWPQYYYLSVVEKVYNLKMKEKLLKDKYYEKKNNKKLKKYNRNYEYIFSDKKENRYELNMIKEKEILRNSFELDKNKQQKKINSKKNVKDNKKDCISYENEKNFNFLKYEHNNLEINNNFNMQDNDDLDDYKLNKNDENHDNINNQDENDINNNYNLKNSNPKSTNVENCEKNELLYNLHEFLGKKEKEKKYEENEKIKEKKREEDDEEKKKKKEVYIDNIKNNERIKKKRKNIFIKEKLREKQNAYSDTSSSSSNNENIRKENIKKDIDYILEKSYRKTNQRNIIRLELYRSTFSNTSISTNTQNQNANVPSHENTTIEDSNNTHNSQNNNNNIITNNLSNQNENISEDNSRTDINNVNYRVESFTHGILNDFNFSYFRLGNNNVILNTRLVNDSNNNIDNNTITNNTFSNDDNTINSNNTFINNNNTDNNNTINNINTTTNSFNNNNNTDNNNTINNIATITDGYNNNNNIDNNNAINNMTTTTTTTNSRNNNNTDNNSIINNSSIATNSSNNNNSNTTTNSSNYNSNNNISNNNIINNIIKNNENNNNNTNNNTNSSIGLDGESFVKKENKENEKHVSSNYDNNEYVYESSISNNSKNKASKENNICGFEYKNKSVLDRKMSIEENDKDMISLKNENRTNEKKKTKKKSDDNGNSTNSSNLSLKNNDSKFNNFEDSVNKDNNSIKIKNKKKKKKKKNSDNESSNYSKSFLHDYSLKNNIKDKIEKKENIRDIKNKSTKYFNKKKKCEYIIYDSNSLINEINTSELEEKDEVDIYSSDDQNFLHKKKISILKNHAVLDFREYSSDNSYSSLSTDNTSSTYENQFYDYLYNEIDHKDINSCQNIYVFEKKKKKKIRNYIEKIEDPLWVPQGNCKRFVGHCNNGTDIKEVAFWNDNAILAASDNSEVYVWRIRDGKLLNVLKGHENHVNCVQVHPEGSFLATSGIDKYIQIWQPNNKKEFIFDKSVQDTMFENQKLLELSNTNYFSFVNFSPIIINTTRNNQSQRFAECLIQ